MISGKGFKSESCQKFADANVSILKLVDREDNVKQIPQQVSLRVTRLYHAKQVHGDSHQLE